MPSFSMPCSSFDSFLLMPIRYALKRRKLKVAVSFKEEKKIFKKYFWSKKQTYGKCAKNNGNCVEIVQAKGAILSLKLIQENDEGNRCCAKKKTLRSAFFNFFSRLTYRFDTVMVFTMKSPTRLAGK